jgi:uncharacterized membrane protein
VKRITKGSLAFERMLFFSDAVFAIAVTLLAIDLRLAADIRFLSDRELLRGLASLWPKYLSFLISFYVISRYWASHHRIFRTVADFDEGLLAINIVFLLFVVFIPFPTTVLGGYFSYRYAVMFYGAALFLPGLVLLLLWLYATKRGRLVGSSLSPARLRSLRGRMSVRLLVPPVVFGASVAVALFSIIAATLMWAALGPILFVLARSLRVEQGREPEA